MRTHEALELSDDGGMPPVVEIRLDSLFETRHPELRQPRDLALCEGLVSEVRKRLPVPFGEGLGEPALLGKALEALDVELAVLDPDLVAGSPGEDAVPADRLAELGDVDLQRLVGGVRRALAPERLHQLILRDDTVRTE